MVRRQAQVADEAVQERNKDSLQGQVVPLQGKWCGKENGAPASVPPLGQCQVSIREVCKGLQVVGRYHFKGCVEARLVLNHFGKEVMEERMMWPVSVQKLKASHILIIACDSFEIGRHQIRQQISVKEIQVGLGGGKHYEAASCSDKVVQETCLVGVEAFQIAQQEDPDTFQQLFVQIREDSTSNLQNGIGLGRGIECPARIVGVGRSAPE